MAADQGKQEEEKFDFTREGETRGYISLDQARVLAMRTAREAPSDYGRRYRNVTMAFEVVEDSETEDHYVVTLSFRPQGRFTGAPGQEQFFIEKEGTVAVRQVLGLPTSGGIRRFLLNPVTVGTVVVAAAAVIGVVLATGGGRDDQTPQAAVPPASTSVLVPSPISPVAATIPVGAVNPAITPASPLGATARAANRASRQPLARTPAPRISNTGLRRGGTVSGRVIDGDTGQPISGINILADNVINGGPDANSRTDGSGRYTIRGVAPGRYRLRPISGYGDYIPKAYDGRLDWEKADIITVGEGDVFGNLDFALKLGATISGAVTDAATGLPLSNIAVNTGPESWNHMVATETDTLGRYILRGLPSGVMEVEVSGEGSDYVEDRRRIRVSGDGHYPNIDFSLVAGTTVSGRVTDQETGRPITNQHITIDNVLGGNAPHASGYTDADGRYTLRGIAPGTYNVRPCCSGMDYVREFYDDKLTRDVADVIIINGVEPVESIDFALKMGAKVTGNVRDGATGLPIPRMRVRAEVAAGSSRRSSISESYTDNQGLYTLHGVPDGAIVVVVGGQGYVEQRMTITVTGGRDVTGVDF